MEIFITMYWIYSEVQVEVHVCKLYFNRCRSNLMTVIAHCGKKNSVMYRRRETVTSGIRLQNGYSRYHLVCLAWPFDRPVLSNIGPRS